MNLNKSRIKKIYIYPFFTEKKKTLGKRKQRKRSLKQSFTYGNIFCSLILICSFLSFFFFFFFVWCFFLFCSCFNILLWKNDCFFDFFFFFSWQKKLFWFLSFFLSFFLRERGVQEPMYHFQYVFFDGFFLSNIYMYLLFYIKKNIFFFLLHCSILFLLFVCLFVYLII